MHRSRILVNSRVSLNGLKGGKFPSPPVIMERHFFGPHPFVAGSDHLSVDPPPPPLNLAGSVLYKIVSSICLLQLASTSSQPQVTQPLFSLHHNKNSELKLRYLLLVLSEFTVKFVWMSHLRGKQYLTAAHEVVQYLDNPNHDHDSGWKFSDDEDDNEDI